MFIMAFDPGQTTGVAMFQNNQFTTTHLGPSPHHAALRDFILRPSMPSVLVCESFDSRGGLVKFVSCEYIGVIRSVAQEFHIPLHLQPPSLGQESTFWNDTNLHLLALWKPVIHERDALRHLLHYMYKMKEPRVRELLESLK